MNMARFRHRALARRGVHIEPDSRLAPCLRRACRGCPHVGFMGNLRPRTMDAGDIRDLLKWQARERAAPWGGIRHRLRVCRHGLPAIRFLLPDQSSHRRHGGSIANRVRLVRELLEVTRDAVGAGAASPCASVWKSCGASRASTQHPRLMKWFNCLARSRSLGRQNGFQPTDCAPSRFASGRQSRAHREFRQTTDQKPVVGVVDSRLPMSWCRR